uniref:Uncharacterized protein n=1 Tax=Pyrodinium bahamense TaxID=73915 RepID=A0A7S0AIV2_9DINO|mmetsp:Transcript_35222/g.97429  ORF Transcript_35222/g.97429 Transcript_35222/m.97429 type:complete len:177 (+) Transcript_35222:2-532(+)
MLANTTRTKTFPQYFAKRFERGVEVAELSVRARDREVGELLFALAALPPQLGAAARLLGKPKGAGAQEEGQATERSRRTHTVRVETRQSMAQPEKPVVIEVAADTPCEGLAARVAEAVAQNAGVELQLAGTEAASNAVLALERVDSSDSLTKELLFAPHYMLANDTTSISVSVVAA